MTDKDNVSDFFDRFGGRASTPPAAPAGPALVSSKEEYRAAVPFVAGEERVRLRARYSNGKQEYWAYMQLTNVFTDSPEYVGLLFNQGGIWCEGDNLGALFDTLQENCIKELVAFDPTRHKEPAQGEPIIRKLEARRANEIVEQFGG